MNLRVGKKLLFIGCSLLWAVTLCAQTTYPNQGGYQGGTVDSQGRPINNMAGKKDSLQHRDRYADSITIYYRYFDAPCNRCLDSSLTDFTTRLPQPYWSINLGNYGTASRSLLFSPVMKAGWDEGLHQFDQYNYRVEDTRLFNTTRPYTELAYLLGNRSEQIVNILHTQNRKSNFNFSFEYRFTNSPGVFRTQNASNNNIRFTSHYQSPNKRYETFLIFLSNKNASSENGGIKDITKLDSLALGDPFELETHLGAGSASSRNPFNTTVTTGNIYKENIFLFRHQYDLGQKDSLVTDSVTIKLFYARIRLQHNLTIKTNSYQFLDDNVDTSATGSYRTYFNYAPATDTIRFKDTWDNVTNELSLITFPEKNNQSQFLKLSAAFQLLSATFRDTATHHFHNIFASAEYRNRTRNQKWDVEANGQLYLNGMHAGDYAVFISLKRELGKRVGLLQLGFQNVNRTPSFIFDPLTNFHVTDKQNFNKENTTRLFSTYENPRYAFRLSGEYFLVSNYAYFNNFFNAVQESTLFNLLHISAEKKFRLSRHWNWYAELHLQQTTGSAPVHVPFFLTRNRLEFEANFYKNLFLATGIEMRYYSNYKADNYSPFTGQFFYQDSYTTANRPDVNIFFHMRIKSFKAFVRLENVNTLNPSKGFSFSKYNFVAQQYPYQGLWFRFGIWWNFVN